MEREKAPAYQVYPSEIQSDRWFKLMNMTERGLWWTLRMDTWFEHGIPDDPELLARLANLSQDEFDQLWRMVSKVFSPHPSLPGTLIDQYIENNRVKQAEFRASRSAGGKASAEARAQKKADGKGMSTETEVEATEFDPKKFVFTDGAKFICSLVKMKESDARSFLGKMVREHGEPAAVHAVQRAMSQKPVNPVEFITGAAQTFAGKRGGTSKASQSQAAAEEAIKAMENGNG